MSYRFEPSETIESGLPRIVREQIEKAIAEIDDPALDRDESVHQVRQRCKKIRAALRLARPALGEAYARENLAFRDLARGLSPARDTRTVVDVFDRLLAKASEAVLPPAARAAISAALRERWQRLLASGDLPSRLQEARASFLEAANRTDWWALHADDGDTLARGFEKSYRRGRNAMQEAYQQATPEAFHEWRKQAKYQRYHVNLLGGAWKPVKGSRRSDARVLSDLLGDEHDLHVLSQAIVETCGVVGEMEGVAAAQALALIEQRRGKLRKKARALGRRVYGEKPVRLVRRLKRRWNAQNREVEPLELVSGF